VIIGNAGMKAAYFTLKISKNIFCSQNYAKNGPKNALEKCFFGRANFDDLSSASISF
jgi:hypothetical protein